MPTQLDYERSDKQKLAMKNGTEVSVPWVVSSAEAVEIIKADQAKRAVVRDAGKAEQRAKARAAVEVFNALPLEQRKPINAKFKAYRQSAPGLVQYNDWLLTYMTSAGLLPQ